MSLDKNSIAFALIDAQVDNIQQQQKQDALNYTIFQLRKTLGEVSDELDVLIKKVETIKDVS
tara:strand:+ start:510 stop:695 length:186 start_codon:yes stop_codon:yes gene_type:complete